MTTTETPYTFAEPLLPFFPRPRLLLLPAHPLNAMAFALRASSAIGARPASASRRAAAPRSLGSALPIRSARRTSSPSSPSSSSRAAIAAPPTNAPNHSVDFVSVVFGSKMSSFSVPAEKGDKKALRPLQNGAFLSTSFPRSERGGASAAKKERNAVAPTGAPSSRLVPFPALFAPSSIVDIICGHRAVEKATLRRRRVKRQNKWRAGESLGRNSLGRKIEYRTRSLALVRRR